MKSKTPKSFDEREEIAADKRALRVLRDEFHVEPEVEFEKLLACAKAQRTLGKIIARYALPVMKRR